MPVIRDNPARHAAAFLGEKVRQARRVGLWRTENALVSNFVQQPEHQINRLLEAVDNAERFEDGRHEFCILPDGVGQTAALKDNIVTHDAPTTCASSILQGFHAPSATVVKLLEKAGVHIAAKTNMDEFGMGSHSTHSIHGAVHNGKRPIYSAGGSSGGSAVAVSKGFVDFALGSDTGGSVRLPAAYTQTFGFKPSYGRISRNGLIPYANSLDTVGILAKSCDSVMEAFNILDHPDPKDPTCLSQQTRDRIQVMLQHRLMVKHQHDGGEKPDFLKLRTPLKACRIGIPVEYNIAELHPVVLHEWTAALSHLKSMGHKIIPISLPTTKEALSAYYVIAPAEASSNLAKYDGVRYGASRAEDSPDNEGGALYAGYRSKHFGEEVRRRILLGTFSLSAGAIDNYFIQAQKVRRLVQDDFNLVFRMKNPLTKTEYLPEGVDFIICPTAPSPPPRLSQVRTASPLQSYVADVYTVPASLAGLPALSVPSLRSRNYSEDMGNAVGIQVIGQFGDDEAVLSFAAENLSVASGPSNYDSRLSTMKRASIR